jgi:hypothetical protein
VREVRVAQHSSGLASQGPGEHPVPHRGLKCMGSEEVRGPPDRRANPAVVVCLHQVFGDLGAGPSIRTSSPIGQVLGQRTVHPAVGVEVVSEGERRMQLWRSDLGHPSRIDVYYGMADSRIGAARLDVPSRV